MDSVYKGFGTLVTVNIQSTGIVMAIDSRTCYYMTGSPEHNEPVAAYYDEACKMFHIGKYMVAIIGRDGIGKWYYSKIFNDFDNSEFQSDTISGTFQNFVRFLDINYPVLAFPDREKCILLIAGFENGKPLVLQGNTAHPNKVRKFNSGFIFSDPGCVKYGIANESLRLPIYKMLEKTIRDYAAAENRQDQINGPISIVSIRPGNNIKYIKNDFSNNQFDTTKDLYDAYKLGRINFTVLNTRAVGEVIQRLNIL